MTSGSQLDNAIRDEADRLLYEKGLYKLLKEYGQPYLSGSYELGLMTWRDLDIYLAQEAMDVGSFFRLGSALAGLLHPVKMSFRNEFLGKSPGLPEGLYWGVYLGNERKGAWKIDIWMVQQEELSRLMHYCEKLKERLTEEYREIILGIKATCWTDPAYRKHYSSTDIYQAVLEENVKSPGEFRQYLHAKGTKEEG